MEWSSPLPKRNPLPSLGAAAALVRLTQRWWRAPRKWWKKMTTIIMRRLVCIAHPELISPAFLRQRQHRSTRGTRVHAGADFVTPAACRRGPHPWFQVHHHRDRDQRLQITKGLGGEFRPLSSHLRYNGDIYLY